MTCPKPDSAAAIYLTGNQRIEAGWTYTVPPPAGFTVELQQQEGASPAWTTVGAAYVPPSYRKHLFDGYTPIPGETYRVRIATRCLDCVLSNWKNSSPVSIPVGV